MAETPVEVFISYSHKDERYRKELGEHLSNLRRQGIIADWHDRKISPGADWASEIDTNLNTAQIILLLISPAFMSSEYCYGIEMKRALERHDTKEAWVIPIILRPVDWENAPFARLQVRPTYAKPVSKWHDRDDAYLDIVQGIRMAINELKPVPEAKLGEDLSLEQQSTFHVPFLRNPYFTGRDDILERLHNRLITSKTFQPRAISGLGGIGKTQIAVEYAYRYQDDYDFILWIKAESRESIISDFVTTAHLLNLPEQKEQEQSRVIQAVKRWFQDHEGWLLIFDNADDLTLLRDFLLSGSKGHILLTTREQATGRIAQCIEIEKMEREEGTLFLLRRTGLLAQDAPLDAASPAISEVARELVQVMAGLPLALDQAGAFIEETRCSLSDYLLLFQTRQADLLQRRGRLATDHPDSVGATFSLSFEKIQQANPTAAELLHLCAFLDPDGIQEEIFTEGISELSPTLQSIAADPIKLNETIGDLLTYSLVRRTSDHTLTVHRLVQAVLQDMLAEAERRSWAERAVLLVNAVFPHAEHEIWPQCERLLPQALTAIQVIERYQVIGKEAGRLLHETAFYLRDRGRYTEAEPLYQRAIRIREQLLGPEHPDVATSLYGLANLYLDQGRYAEAEPLYQRAIRIREQFLGPQHPDMAYPLTNLANLYREQGRYAEAESLYQRALHIREQALGPQHLETARTMQELAQFREAQGYDEEAMTLYARALTIREQALGAHNPKTTETRKHLIALLHTVGQFEEAAQLEAAQTEP